MQEVSLYRSFQTSRNGAATSPLPLARALLATTTQAYNFINTFLYRILVPRITQPKGYFTEDTITLLQHRLQASQT